MAYDLSSMSNFIKYGRAANPYAGMTVDQNIEQTQQVAKNDYELSNLAAQANSRNQLSDYMNSLYTPAQSAQVAPQGPQTFNTPYQGTPQVAPIMGENARPLPFGVVNPNAMGSENYLQASPLLKPNGAQQQTTPMQPATQASYAPIDYNRVAQIVTPTNPTEAIGLRRADVQEQHWNDYLKRGEMMAAEKEAQLAKVNQNTIFKNQQQQLTGISPEEYTDKYNYLLAHNSNGMDYTSGLPDPNGDPNQISSFLKGFAGKGAAYKPMTPQQQDTYLQTLVAHVKSDPSLQGNPQAQQDMLMNLVKQSGKPELMSKFGLDKPTLTDQAKAEDEGTRQLYPAGTGDVSQEAQAMGNKNLLTTMGINPALADQINSPNPASWGSPQTPAPVAAPAPANSWVKEAIGDSGDNNPQATGMVSTDNGVTVNANGSAPTTFLTPDQALNLYSKPDKNATPSALADHLEKSLPHYMAGVTDGDRYTSVRKALRDLNSGMSQSTFDAMVPEQYDPKFVNAITTGGDLKAQYLDERNTLAKKREEFMDMGMDKTTAGIATSAVNSANKVRDQFVDKKTNKLLIGIQSHINSADEETGFGANNSTPSRAAVVEALAQIESGGKSTSFSTEIQTQLGQILHNWTGVQSIPDQDWGPIRKVAQETFEQWQNNIIPMVREKATDVASDYLATAGNTGVKIKEKTLDMVDKGIFDFTVPVKDRKGNPVKDGEGRIQYQKMSFPDATNPKFMRGSSEYGKGGHDAPPMAPGILGPAVPEPTKAPPSAPAPIVDKPAVHAASKKGAASSSATVWK